MNFLNDPTAHSLTFVEQQGSVYRFEWACDQNSPGSFLHLPPRLLKQGDPTEAEDIPYNMRFQRMEYEPGVELLGSMESVLGRLDGGDVYPTRLFEYVYYEVSDSQYEPAREVQFTSPQSPEGYEIPPLNDWTFVPSSGETPDLYVPSSPVVVSRGPGWGACEPVVDVLKDELPLYPDVQMGYQHTSFEYFGSPASQRQKIREAKVGDVVFPPYWSAHWMGINCHWILHVAVKAGHDADFFGDPNPEQGMWRAYTWDSSLPPPDMYWTDGGNIEYFNRPQFYGWDQWNKYEPFVFSDLCLFQSPATYDGSAHYHSACVSEEFHEQMGSNDSLSPQPCGCNQNIGIMSKVEVYAFWEPTPRKREPVMGVANLTALGLLSGLVLCCGAIPVRPVRRRLV